MSRCAYRSYAPLPQVCGEGLGLVYGDVGLQRDRYQVVDNVAFDQPVRPPVVGKPNGVKLLALEVVDRDTVAHKRLAVDLATRRLDGYPVGVLDTLLLGQLGADLGEELRLQLVEPGDPTAHCSAGVVLGEPVGGYHVRVVWVLGLVVWVVGPVERSGRGIVVLL